MNTENQKLIDRYIMLRTTNGLTSESIKAIRGELGLFLRYLEKTDSKHISEVTHIDVEDFLQCCATGELTGKTNGAAALNRKFAAINTFYNTMIKKEYIDCKNPFDKVDKIKDHRKLRKHLDISEYNQLLLYLDETENIRDAALISFFYSSACRLSEVIQQNRNSLNFEKRQFVVVGKGQKERLCIFNHDAVERIKRYLDTRKDDNTALFISSLGNRLSKKAIQDAVKKAGKSAGINKNVHPHIFRHTRAMHLLKQGVPLETIQRLLGHSSIATTQVYAHSSLEDLQGQIDEIDKKVG
ncbi:tyrosine-type recombinase/integrase [Petroclostridium sp. X23]|uniref:tyrosine-type recombinase/integrase n=1 Tax=Petroclostridium sp. X23 TaxID=3045146 RepID=UPI0024AD16AA|nr:tyrosine-type recombinase/integrase [Petroclostridium sp. X23]WHH59192.1 tyrosine-type recombinase/integrase [Petroclostridium sp. X23]